MVRSTWNSPRLWIAAAGLVIAGSSLQAQVQQEKLTKLDAAFPESFSLIRSIIELPDGRVLVADPLEQVLLALDMKAQTADTIGSVGAGPEEYKQPDGVFALPGDSTLLVDLGNGRLTFLGPNHKFGETTPIATGSPMPGRGGMRVIIPRGVDSQGRVYFQPLGMGMNRAQPPDSAPVARWDRASDTIDTLGLVGLEKRKTTTSGGPNERMQMIRPVPLSPVDAWAVAPDGRIAVARSGDYHVEWVRPNGTVVVGPPVPYKPVKIRRAEKEEWIDSQGNGLSMSVEVGNGQVNMSFGRGRGGRGTPSASDYEWPDTKPAFTANGVWVAPNGEMWVERHVPAGTPRTFDVFGADAKIKRQIVLPEGRRLAGFGAKGAIYLIHVDEFDLQTFERYYRTET